ncbi:MAG: DUF4396 domain-containing protein [Proteobacteria bacterium]|nr:DUF4396 domain-containing protein [Pseudomonadota bacterium]
MSLVTMAGMVTAYPINSWMVRRGLKHGMMSAQPKSNQKKKPQVAERIDSDSSMGMSHDMQVSTHASALSTGKMLTVLIGTFAVLATSLWITTLFAPIRF